MADQVVSVRMPASLVQELKAVAEKNHYLDLSETLRSLLRDKWLEQPDAKKAREVRKKLSRIAEPGQIEALKKTLSLLEEMHEL